MIITFQERYKCNDLKCFTYEICHSYTLIFIEFFPNLSFGKILSDATKCVLQLENHNVIGITRCHPSPFYYYEANRMET